MSLLSYDMHVAHCFTLQLATLTRTIHCAGSVQRFLLSMPGVLANQRGVTYPSQEVFVLIHYTFESPDFLQLLPHIVCISVMLDTRSYLYRIMIVNSIVIILLLSNFTCINIHGISHQQNVWYHKQKQL